MCSAVLLVGNNSPLSPFLFFVLSHKHSWKIGFRPELLGDPSLARQLTRPAPPPFFRKWERAVHIKERPYGTVRTASKKTPDECVYALNSTLLCFHPPSTLLWLALIRRAPVESCPHYWNAWLVWDRTVNLTHRHKATNLRGGIETDRNTECFKDLNS